MTIKPAPPVLARHLPELRADLVAWLRDPGPEGGPAIWARGHEPTLANTERQAADDWARALSIAELFAVNAPMTRLAVAAGAALPAYRLHPEDLPATHGLLAWEEPATDPHEGGNLVGAPIVGISWAVHGGGVHIRTWVHRDDWAHYMAQGDPRAGIRDLTPAETTHIIRTNPAMLVAMSGGYLPFGRIPGWLTSPDDTTDMSLTELEDLSRSATRQEQAERALVVTWLLMGQTLSTVEDVRAPRASEKRIARIDPNLLGTVRCVQLRHRNAAPVARGEQDVGRAYRHRWIVRGHWRNQYYASREEHRPIWIDPHTKGPDGAPILDPEKLVNVLRR
ncbi:hypothetical protein [Embleya sp. NPDC005971]|uniref:hypothetical protein n=1 Tax=Embleya sp. NPDC005971 TaxID=3156724 RepID=UPI0033DA5F45